MPRQKIRKTDKGNFSEEAMTRGVNLVLQGESLRAAASRVGLKFQTLARYVKKKKENPDANIRMTPNYSVNKVFTSQQEDQLAEYLLKCSKMFYGLPRSDCRKLAYEMAVRNGLNYPKSWDRTKEAGVDWMWGFMRRHPQLSLRTPEGCSLSRATSFNRHNVNQFFDNLKTIFKRYENLADGTRIYNLDETATTTVQKSSKVIAEKGIKQVSKVTSAERGTLVTTCVIVSASGNSLPPAMIFPRVHFKSTMTVGAPPGTLGMAHKSGWMNSELFLQVMSHFIKHTQSSLANPTLLIYDNHESHLSIEVINLAKDNGVIVLTIPPHSSNKLQPLDVGIFKPFNNAYNSAVDAWLMQNPGQPLTIYQVASCVGYAHQKALTPGNITAAFRKCGIFPYDSNVFTDVDFLCSSVTDRPIHPNENPLDLPASSSTSVNLNQTPPGTPNKTQQLNESIFISPEVIRGYPKAKDRKENRQNRRKGRSIIATDTPEKTLLAERSLKRKRPFTSTIKKKVFVSEDSTSEEEIELVESDTSEDDVDVIPQSLPSGFEELDRAPINGDFILVEFKQEKKNDVYYIGKVVKTEDTDLEVSFLRKSSKCLGKFIFPVVEDISLVRINDIKMILPPPSVQGATKRQNSYYSFEINFASLEMR